VNVAALTLFELTPSTRVGRPRDAAGIIDITRRKVTGKYLESNGRHRRQAVDNTCGRACIVSLQKLLDEIIQNGTKFSTTLQYRQNCSTLVYSQDNVIARLVQYDTRIRTTVGK
jgi:hypothetical protein